MSASISADIRALIRDRVESSSSQEILRIASAIAANEQITAVSSFHASRGKPVIASVADGGARFTNLDDEGKPTGSNHAWVYDSTTGLVWARGMLAGELNFEDAQKACAKVAFLGQACRAPTLQERFSINDYTKHSPALDTAHFAKESGWEWTSTIDASSPRDFAWGVGLGFGYVVRSYQSGRGRVRPVLAGQQFSFDL